MKQSQEGRKVEGVSGRREGGVGVMQDDELKLEEIEAPHTLCGAGEVARGEGRGDGVDATPLSCTLTEIHQSRGGRQNMPGCVAITDAPENMSGWVPITDAPADVRGRPFGGGTGTTVVSQRSEAGQGILCAKTGKYDMLHDVVKKLRLHFLDLLNRGNEALL
jgi:hypothetical protein